MKSWHALGRADRKRRQLWLKTTAWAARAVLPGSQMHTVYMSISIVAVRGHAMAFLSLLLSIFFIFFCIHLFLLNFTSSSPNNVRPCFHKQNKLFRQHNIIDVINKLVYSSCKLPYYTITDI